MGAQSSSNPSSSVLSDYLASYLAHFGIDPELPAEELRLALLAAIAREGGEVTWSSEVVKRPTRAYADERGVVIASTEDVVWVAQIRKPFERVTRGSTLEEALAWCFVGLSSPLQKFYREVDAFLALLRIDGHAAWAERIDAVIRAGFTGGEVLSGLRFELYARLRGDAQLEEARRQWAIDAIGRVNRFLGPSLPDVLGPLV